jgi:hypothetical protein
MLAMGGGIGQIDGLSLSTWNQLQAKEAAHAAVLILQEALKRRLWEPPPDDQCLKAKTFGVAGTFGPSKFTTSASVDFDSDTITLVGSAALGKSTASMVKYLRSFDVGDILLYSSAAAPVKLEAAPESPYMLSLLGEDKMIYMEGPLQLYTRMSTIYGRTYSKSFSDVRPPFLPKDIRLLIQSQRMYLLGGIRYDDLRGVIPNDIMTPQYEDEKNTLQPYAGLVPSASSGYSIFTSDYDRASQAVKLALNGGPWDGKLDPLMKGVYPYAMGGSSLPVTLENAADTGTYFNDPSRLPDFNFLYGAYFGWHTSVSCVHHQGSGQFCSDSLKFPKSFDNWRKSAGLENIVITDAKLIKTKSLNWDNFDALKEDAQVCGINVTSSTASHLKYMDCDLTDSKRMLSYISTGSDPCEPILQTDLTEWTAKFPHFSSGVYQSLSSPRRALRRVIYADTDIEIAQSSEKGLWPSLDKKTRGILPIWIVNEQKTQIRPYQPLSERSSPLNDPTPRMRKLFFNKDTSSSSVPSLKLVFLTRNPISVVSSFHQALSFSDLKAAYPQSGGVLKAKTSILTDAQREENDGFKYGLRSVELSNLAIISSDQVPVDNTFYMRGLWSGFSTGIEQSVRNACIFAGSDAPLVEGLPPLPATRPSDANPYLPPEGSRFYKNGNQINNFAYVAEVFNRFYQNALLLDSILNLSGRRVVLHFSGTDAARGDLGERRYAPASYYPVDWGDRKIVWDNPHYFSNTGPGGRLCKDPWIMQAGSFQASTSVNYIPLNRGDYKFSLSTPTNPDNYLGALWTRQESVMEAQK